MLVLLDVPDPQPGKLDLSLICPEMGWSNLMALTTSTASWTPEMQGTLSIKCAFKGKETYEVDGRRLPVHAENYLILNQGQWYSSTLDAGERAESFCLFFRPRFVEEGLRVLTTPDDAILDAPVGESRGPVQFFDKLYRHDDIISPLLFNFYSTVKSHGAPSRGWLEEQFHFILEGMLRVHRGVAAEIRRLPSIRRATRVEIYRRLSRAKDFIESNFTTQINLGVIAREANLSTYHFLRLFKSAFGITPHQYLTRIRLEKARELLLSTGQPVSAICFDLGFESPSSFSLLFRRHYGTAPADFRRNGNNEE